MKPAITILTLILTFIPTTNSFFKIIQPKHCRSPFSHFGSWPYYSYDYYDHPFCPKAYDDYYS